VGTGAGTGAGAGAASAIVVSIGAEGSDDLLSILSAGVEVATPSAAEELPFDKESKAVATSADWANISSAA
jgi:hypothetical protein